MFGASLRCTSSARRHVELLRIKEGLAWGAAAEHVGTTTARQQQQPDGQDERCGGRVLGGRGGDSGWVIEANELKTIKTRIRIKRIKNKLAGKGQISDVLSTRSNGQKNKHGAWLTLLYTS